MTGRHPAPPARPPAARRRSPFKAPRGRPALPLSARTKPNPPSLPSPPRGLTPQPPKMARVQVAALALLALIALPGAFASMQLCKPNKKPSAARNPRIVRNEISGEFAGERRRAGDGAWGRAAAGSCPRRGAATALAAGASGRTSCQHPRRPGRGHGRVRRARRVRLVAAGGCITSPDPRRPTARR